MLNALHVVHPPSLPTAPKAIPALGTNVQFAARAYYKCWSEPTPVQAALVTGTVNFPPGNYNGTVVSSSAVVASVGWERS